MAFTLSRYKREWKVFTEAFKNAPPATHRGGELANKLVFASGASPYIAGHGLLVSLVLIVVGVILI